MVSWTVAVDIGGTFTDLVAYDATNGRTVYSKSPTTPGDLSRGILSVLEKAGIRLDQTTTIKHGTTVVINTVLEATGARVGLLTTRGFRDVLEIGRGNRPQPFDLRFRRLPPLVPRRMRYEVSERVLPGGVVHEPLSQADVLRAARQLRADGVEAVAVAFLHAYADPTHEEQAAALLAAQGFAYVSVSSDLSREWREFERTSTAVLNAYVMPRVGAYLERLEGVLAEHGFRGRLYMMESNGGVMSVATTRRKPIFLVESGPVAGVTGATAVAAAAGYANVVAFDMGGTTAKASVVENLAPRIEPLYYVGGYERGYAVQAPVVDIVEVGAGGGSIAWLDTVQNLHVGPRSAGAEPGPACYGQGGREPTVTDANLVLGRLSPDRFLGGEMALDAHAARRALEERVSGPLAQDALRIAAGIVRIANVVMAGAVRRVTVERGRDPRDFVLIAFGGAGPLHAVAIAREVGIPKVIVPSSPGHFSALGMLLADLRHDYALSYVVSLDCADLQATDAAFAEMEATGHRLAREEIPGLTAIAVTRWADMRYVGQEHTVKVPWPEQPGAANDWSEIIARFRQTYATRYGYSDPSGAVELVTLRVSVEGRSGKPSLTSPYTEAPGATLRGERDVYFEELGGLGSCPIYRREALPVGWTARGPVVVEEYASTTIVHPGCTAAVIEGGLLEIVLGGARDSG